MVEHSETPVNAGEQVTNAPSSLPFKPEDQFRLVNQRLDNLATEIGRISKPAQFRMADLLTVGTVVIGFILAFLTASGLDKRIDNMRVDQAAAERRLSEGNAAMELRLGAKLEKLSDQFSAFAERIARIEGEKGEPPK